MHPAGRTYGLQFGAESFWTAFPRHVKGSAHNLFLQTAAKNKTD